MATMFLATDARTTAQLSAVVIGLLTQMDRIMWLEQVMMKNVIMARCVLEERAMAGHVFMQLERAGASKTAAHVKTRTRTRAIQVVNCILRVLISVGTQELEQPVLEGQLQRVMRYFVMSSGTDMSAGSRGMFCHFMLHVEHHR